MGVGKSAPSLTSLLQPRTSSKWYGSVRLKLLVISIMTSSGVDLRHNTKIYVRTVVKKNK